MVGEYGCGKTTVAKLMMRLIEPDAGGALGSTADRRLALGHAALRPHRHELQ